MTTSKRPLTLAQAKAHYPHRFTCEHVPRWALTPAPNGKYYAPQYSTDQEWYDHSAFYPEPYATRRYCYSPNPTWPKGEWLDQPYRKS